MHPPALVLCVFLASFLGLLAPIIALALMETRKQWRVLRCSTVDIHTLYESTGNLGDEPVCAMVLRVSITLRACSSISSGAHEMRRRRRRQQRSTFSFQSQPCRSKEIEFTLPPGAFSLTPPRSRRGQQKLDIPTKKEPPTTLSPGDASGGNNVRQRRFSTALLFPGRTDGSASPLLSPSILLHCSAPSSPIPNYSPSPAHSPCLSPLPSVDNSLLYTVQLRIQKSQKKRKTLSR